MKTEKTAAIMITSVAIGVISYGIITIHNLNAPARIKLVAENKAVADAQEKEIKLVAKRLCDMNKKAAVRTAVIKAYRETAVDAKIAEGLRKGIIHSINIEFNEVRISPFTWMGLNIEEKQSLVTSFSKYFDIKGSTGRVTILSSLNDTKLATYNSLFGMRILK